MLKPADMTD